MVQIISSAIMNAPPPNPVVKLLVQTNFAGEGVIRRAPARNLSLPQSWCGWVGWVGGGGADSKALPVCTHVKIQRASCAAPLPPVLAEKLDGTLKQKMVRLHLSNRPKLHKLIANRNWCVH
jgi:hypothetical protein